MRLSSYVHIYQSCFTDKNKIYIISSMLRTLWTLNNLIQLFNGISSKRRERIICYAVI